MTSITFLPPPSHVVRPTNVVFMLVDFGILTTTSTDALLFVATIPPRKKNHDQSLPQTLKVWPAKSNALLPMSTVQPPSAQKSVSPVSWIDEPAIPFLSVAVAAFPTIALL